MGLYDVRRTELKFSAGASPAVPTPGKLRLTYRHRYPMRFGDLRGTSSVKLGRKRQWVKLISPTASKTLQSINVAAPTGEDEQSVRQPNRGIGNEAVGLTPSGADASAPVTTNLAREKPSLASRGTFDAATQQGVYILQRPYSNTDGVANSRIGKLWSRVWLTPGGLAHPKV